MIEKQLKCAMFTAIGSTVQQVTELQASYDDALFTFSFKDLPRTASILTYEAIQARTGGRTVCAISEERELAELLHRGDVGALRYWIKQIIQREWSDPEVTPSSMKDFLNSVVLSGHRWLERVVGAAEYERIVSTRLTNEPFDLSASLEDQMHQRLQSFSVNYHGAASGTPESSIQRARVYIRENLHKNLSLKDVADWVHWNPNHFSEMFKRETGITYIEFVKRERIEKAIHILQETPAKVSEVAHEVGYEDVKYFSQLFKKYTGKTPSEFRGEI
jgi:two-component system response regulator YesN